MDNGNQWHSLCRHAALALLPYARVNRLWLQTAVRCIKHTWRGLSDTGRYLGDVLTIAPPIYRQGLANSINIATIPLVSHRRAAAVDAMFWNLTFPNLTVATIVLGDHSDRSRDLCSTLSTKPHVPTARCPNLSILTIERARENPSWCECGEDGVYALPDEWRALFKQITVCRRVHSGLS